MSNNQYSRSHPNSVRNSASMQHQTVNPYAALVATAGPEHDGRSASSGTSPSSGSSVSHPAHSESATLQVTSSRPHTHDYGGSISLPQHVSLPRRSTHTLMRVTDLDVQAYKSSEQNEALGFSTDSTHTRPNYAVRAAGPSISRGTDRASVASASYAPNIVYGHQESQASSLFGVPESVAVQEMAFRQGQRDNGSPCEGAMANPFARQFDQLWTAFYKMGKECGGQRAPTPVNLSQQNFTWSVLVNPYTQSLQNPNGSLDPAWSRKMIQAALNCMEELVRITCRRNNGWEKTVADIPLPAQEALVAFPDLADQYEQLKRDAKEARAGGRPYGY
ncbi:hypothetical protein OPT61_g8599 [Boeremia exigua]|uniref:Uncharacterized protein n=1 Tax=Boeremia exigua TaxID=749465 RepID=A0ACC2HYG2_9PLEO|nr:hypothetical protein OPT61_g8599 [Boeremia exigua]